MTDDQLIAAITKNVQGVFRQEDFVYRPDFAFRDIIGFDSVQAVMFILEMESALSITLNEDEVDRMFTAGDLFEIARAKLPASSVA
jgi:acyl carrier protein